MVQRQVSEAEERLALLEKRAGMLRGRIEELKGILESLRAERKRLNESARLLRSEALRLREERDKANLEVADARSRLNLQYQELKERRRRLEELKLLLRERRRRLRPKREIRKRITSLEWEISTTPTLEMLPREGELIEKARVLYEELKEYEELEEKKNMVLVLLSEIKAKEIKIKNFKEEINKLKKISAERHEKMLTLYRKAEEEKKRADEIHLKILEYVSEIEKIRDELNKILGEIKVEKLEVRKKEEKFEEEKKLLIEKRKKEIAERVKKKLESKGKISLDELRILYEEEQGVEDNEV